MKYIYTLTFVLLLFGCSQEDTTLNVTETGVAGSYARFLVYQDKLYIIDDTNIKTFSLEHPELPTQIDQQEIGSNIESLFRLDNKLFIGSGSGLYIYEINEEGIPKPKGAAEYELPFEPCDPVVATPAYAYVTLNTLNTMNSCGRTFAVEVNELKIFDIQNIANPNLITSYPMYNPKGLGIDGNLLFLCDDAEGLKIYDVSNPRDIQLIRQFNNFIAYDVIPLNGLLLVVATDNIYQFDYSDVNNIQLISQIPILP